MENNTVNVKEMRAKVADMVKPLWEANHRKPRPIMDRAQALKMLTSNFEREGELNKEILHTYGEVTPEQIAECKEWWISIPRLRRGIEYMAILTLVKKQEW